VRAGLVKDSSAFNLPDDQVQAKLMKRGGERQNSNSKSIINLLKPLSVVQYLIGPEILVFNSFPFEYPRDCQQVRGNVELAFSCLRRGV
jgi:hypothetical protein